MMRCGYVSRWMMGSWIPWVWRLLMGSVKGRSSETSFERHRSWEKTSGFESKRRFVLGSGKGKVSW